MPDGCRAFSLFDGHRWGRQIGDGGLLGVMEAAAQDQKRGDGGKSKDGAHDLIPLLGTVTRVVRGTSPISP